MKDEEINVCADLVNVVGSVQERSSPNNRKSKSKKSNQNRGDKNSSADKVITKGTSKY